MSITIHFKNGSELTMMVTSEGDILNLLLDKNICSVSYNDETEY